MLRHSPALKGMLHSLDRVRERGGIWMKWLRRLLRAKGKLLRGAKVGVHPESDAPLWARWAAEENRHLPELLSYASTNYGRHLDLFMKHAEAGTRNLALILATESALIVGAYTNEIPRILSAALLGILAIMAIIFGHCAIAACGKSYLAAMESVHLVTKTVWAMGLTSNVAVQRRADGQYSTPDDLSLYPSRWYLDACAHSTGKEFAEARMADRENTCFLMRLTLIMLVIGAVAIAGVGGLAVLHREQQTPVRGSHAPRFMAV